MTEEELEQQINDMIDRERKNAITFEIEQLKKAVENVENVSGLHGSKREGERAGVYNYGDQ